MHVEHTDQTTVRSHMNVISLPPSPNGPRVEIRSSVAATADAAAAWLAAQIRTLAATKPVVSVAFSGGKTPAAMLDALASHDVPWTALHVFQVDERCVPLTDERRNAHQLLSTVGSVLSAHGVAGQLHLLPVPDLSSTKSPESPVQSSRTLELATETMQAITNGVFDIIHLGVGDDGHTASLVPGDEVLRATDVDVAYTGGLYQDTRRMTLTYPALHRAGQLCWLATGASKAPVVRRMLVLDPTIPAGPLGAHAGVMFLDADAARLVGQP
jgi:6-phosphogluconolactonase